MRNGQIAHLNQNASDADLDNLAFLCFEHHNEYDSTTRQSKGLTRKEVLMHRAALYKAVEEYLGTPQRQPSGRESQYASPLSSTGELDYYLDAFATEREFGMSVIRRIGDATRNSGQSLAAANAAAMDEIRSGAASVAGRQRYNLRLTSAIGEFARALDKDAEELDGSGPRMLDALSRASAVASDIELADAEMFEGKLGDLHTYRETLMATAESVNAVGESVRGVQRGPAFLNRSRRLAIAALQKLERVVEGHLSEIERHEQHVREVMTLL